MKRALLLLTLVLVGMFAAGTASEDSPKEEAKVYICVSKNAKRYHCDRDCRGLQSCKHEIRIVTIKEAQERGLTPCKVCY